MAEILFWTAVFLIFYAIAGYSLLLLIWPGKPALLFRKPIEPRISILIAARNEAAAIGGKIRHLLELDYPAEKREILVVSDGSTDRTVDALAGYVVNPAVKVFHYAEPRGKAYAINTAAAGASGDILVFNDARQRLAPDALRNLLANFADPFVGCVSGELRFFNEKQPGIKSTLYWRYERWVRRQESRLGTSIGATGAFYAIRRECFRELPEGLILDDVYTPLQIALRGYKTIHDSSAVVYDSEAHSENAEFRRKVRTLFGNYQLVQRLPEALRFSRVGFQFLSHKLIRLGLPFYLLLCLISSSLAPGWFYRSAFAVQVGCYALAAFGVWRGRRAPVWAAAPAAVVILSGAAIVAMVRFFCGKTAAWHK